MIVKTITQQQFEINDNNITSFDKKKYWEEWYKTHGEEVKKRSKDVIKCNICENNYTRANKTTHYKTKKHIIAEKQKKIDEQNQQLKNITSISKIDIEQLDHLKQLIDIIQKTQK